jgi:hypothetical protein
MLSEEFVCNVGAAKCCAMNCCQHFPHEKTVTEQGVTAQICPVTVHFMWIPEWLIRINPAASLMRAADLIFFRGGVCFDCAWDAWGSRYLAVWDGIAGRWRRDWWNECGATLMSDGGDCGGEEIWSEIGLWRKLERENGRVCKDWHRKKEESWGHS